MNTEAKILTREQFQPVYERWRHGGWYVNNIQYPSGAIGCISNNFHDRKWRIVCDSRPFDEQPKFTSRGDAAYAEYLLTKGVSDMRVKKESVEVPTRWKVKGTHPFPIDMLRHDYAWPASEHDSNIITSTIRHETSGPVEVEVCARRPLTIGRWKSFGWDVIGCL